MECWWHDRHVRAGRLRGARQAHRPSVLFRRSQARRPAARAVRLYWRDVHGPLCARLPGLGYYVQHHFARDRWANLWPIPEGVRRMDLVLDGAVEIGFADASDEARFMQASPVLFGDEFNLFAHAVAYNLPQGSQTLVDRQADGIPNGPDALHRFHLHLNGGSRDSIPAMVGRLGRSSWPPRRRCRSFGCTCPSPTTTRTRRLRLRTSTIRSATSGSTSLSSNSASPAPWPRVRFFDSEEYRATVAQQREAIESVGVFPVTSIYTFIRDGEITTAGLRGSRPAQLIAEIGAANQTRAGRDPAVRSRATFGGRRMSRRARTLITGATGQIGSAVLRRVAADPTLDVVAACAPWSGQAISACRRVHLDYDRPGDAGARRSAAPTACSWSPDTRSDVPPQPGFPECRADGGRGAHRPSRRPRRR